MKTKNLMVLLAISFLFFQPFAIRSVVCFAAEESASDRQNSGNLGKSYEKCKQEGDKAGQKLIEEQAAKYGLDPNKLSTNVAQGLKDGAVDPGDFKGALDMIGGSSTTGLQNGYDMAKTMYGANPAAVDSAYDYNRYNTPSAGAPTTSVEPQAASGISSASVGETPAVNPDRPVLVPGVKGSEELMRDIGQELYNERK